MSFGGPFFILAIVAMSYMAWIITTAIRAKHGYPVENDWGKTVRKDNPELARQNDILESENEKLRGTVGRLEERMAVLERIATDAPTRLTAEIDRLRD